MPAPTRTVVTDVPVAPRRARWIAILAPALSLLLMPVGSGTAHAMEPFLAVKPNLVVNGSFELGATGWRTNASATDLRIVPGGVDGSRAASLHTRTGGTAALNDVANTVVEAQAGTAYLASVWIRTDTPGTAGQFRVREVGDGDVVGHDVEFALSGTRWTRLDMSFAVGDADALLDVNVLAWNTSADRSLLVDAVSLTRSAGAEAPGGEGHVAGMLSNGCSYTMRGIPACGAYLGAAVGANDDPAQRESRSGGVLGIHRTYFHSGQVSSAVETARQDLAAGRLPWISFKMPHSWSDMADGRGDAWARDLVTRLDALEGPVWLAFHHEPENDASHIGEWVRMQERLGPMVRNRSDNVAFTLILMGWHQIYGAERMSFEEVWPDTAVDVAGFDTYNLQGAPSNGRIRTEPMDLRTEYFEKFQAWSKRTGVPWALAETGYTDYAARRDPTLLRRTFSDLQSTGGIGLSYFDSPLHSDADWTLSTSEKLADFTAAMRGTARLPKQG